MRPLPVSIIVPVFNGGTAFADCLAALRLLDPDPLEIIVVDDHSTDGSAELASERGFRVLQTPVRSGPASARNLGARASSADVLLFVDADVLVPPNVVARVQAALRCAPEAAAVIGSYDDRAPAQNFFTQYKNLYQRYVHQRARRDAFTFWGACGAIRREVFDAMGGFDVEYGKACIEDIELGYRLRDAGYRIVLDHTLEVTHAKRWTAATLVTSDVLHRAIPWTALILRSRRMDADLNLGWSHRFAVLAAGILAASLAVAMVFPAVLPGAAASAGALALLDARLARYFFARRGAWFTARAMVWQWLHYLYSGAAFGLAFGMYLAGYEPARSRAVRANEFIEPV